MRLPAFLDPFAELTKETYAKLFYARKREREAEARFQTLLKSYKTLLQDVRYQLIAQDIHQTLGHQLQALVRQASRGEDCRALAERVRLLQEIVGEPLQAVWVDAHRPKEEQELAELAPNGQ